jgi:hypothetical protein
MRSLQAEIEEDAAIVEVQRAYALQCQGLRAAAKPLLESVLSQQSDATAAVTAVAAANLVSIVGYHNQAPLTVH